MSFFNSLITRFTPDLADYSKARFSRDLAAGLTVGVVALPLSLALAIASGVPPIIGLYTAGIAGLLASLFAGSPFSISGPAAAMVPILAGVVAEFGTHQLITITLLSGAILILFGFAGLGKLIIKIPQSVVLGFTCGVAIVLIQGQINTFLGLTGVAKGHHFHENVLATLGALTSISWPTVLLGVTCIAIIIYAPRLSYLRHVPSTLIAVAFAITAAKVIPVFEDVQTIAQAYGAITNGLPQLIPNIPAFSPSFVFPAFQIAALIAIETLLCAMVADRLTKTKHNPSQELLAQGIANLGSAIFGGIPATAVIARTGTAVKQNATSRLTGIIHALTVLIFIAVLAPLANSIPLTALSAVLLVTAVRISEYKEVRTAIREHAADFDVTLLTTLLLTVFMDLVVGVTVGLIIYILRRKVFHKAIESRLQLVEDFADDKEA